MLDIDIKTTLGRFILNPVMRSSSTRLALFGASGSGKSLTLEAIAGLLKPQAGHIRVGDKVLFDADQRYHLAPQLRRVGYVTQHYHLFPHLNAEQNIAYSIRNRRQAKAKAQELLELLGLSEFAQRFPEQLSGGQQQRIALARALAREPQLLLLDEPFSALDELVRTALRRRLGELLQGLNIPMIIVTHDLSEATMLADSIAIFEAGQIVQLGSTEEIFNRPSNSQIAMLVGMSNILKTTIVATDGETSVLRWGEHKLLAPKQRLGPGATLSLGIRPEHIIFARSDRFADESETCLKAVITQDIPQGTDRLLRLFVAGGGELEVMLSSLAYARLGLSKGASARILLKREHLWPLK